MKIAIMQPYFLPYIGYFQLVAAVDCFVVYDTIQYTKKGWINRNRMLRDGSAVLFSLPLERASDFLDVLDRKLAASYDPASLLAQIAGAYRKAPEFERTFPLIQDLLAYRGANLFDVIHHALVRCCDHLGIATPIRISSEVEGGAPVLSGAKRVMDICSRTGASTYVNPPGGRALYSAEAFGEAGLQLRFLQPRLAEYPQFGAPFVPSLSILDVMMFNSPEVIRSTMLEKLEIAE